MAKTIPNFEFSKMGNRRSRYDEFFEGQTWSLTIAEDSPHLTDVERLRGAVRSAAARRDFEFQSQIIKEYDEDGEIDHQNSELVFRVYRVDTDANEIDPEDWPENEDE